MNKKTHRVPLPADLADALLNVPFADAAESSPENFNSIGQRLSAARTELASAITAANRVLARNPLTSIIAEHAARQKGKRGTPTVSVDLNGDVMLEIHYLQLGQTLPEVPAKSKLPPMENLRREATSLGIDWKPYGKAKRKLIAAIAAVREGGVPKPATPKPAPVKSKPKTPKPLKKTKTARAQSWASRAQIPINDTDDGVDDLFRQLDGEPPKPVVPPPAKPPAPKPRSPVKLAPKPRPTPKRAVVAAQPVMPRASKLGGRSLSAIAQNADDDIDIEALLAKPASPVPQED